MANKIMSLEDMNIPADVKRLVMDKIASMSANGERSGRIQIKTVSPKEFVGQFQRRIDSILNMAKTNVAGAQLEVDQLRREFMAAFISSEVQLPLESWRDMAKKIETLNPVKIEEKWGLALNEHPR
jgi:hypothetical protein